MPKELSALVEKSKWNKPAKEVETWETWWSMHQKIAKPLAKTAKVIHNWWSFTGNKRHNSKEKSNKRYFIRHRLCTVNHFDYEVEKNLNSRICMLYT